MIIVCIKKGFFFVEIVNFFNINVRILVNYFGGFIIYFIFLYSDFLYKYIIDNIIVLFIEEYYIFLIN